MIDVTIQILANGIIEGSMYALIALGFSTIYGTVRFFHFAHGAVYTVGAYAAYSLAVFLGVNSGAIIITCLVAAVLGVGIDRMVYAPLRRRRAPNLVFLIASFGVFVFLQNLIQLVYGAQILTLRTGPIREGHHFLGVVMTNVQFTILGVSAFLSAGLWLFLQKTKLGKAMRAVADDPIAARIVGINSELTIVVVFAIGSALAGVAGILISLETNIEPAMGMNAILKGIIASIVGGIGSIPGAVLGGLILGIAENVGAWETQAAWKDCIAFVVLVIFLIMRPTGILGSRPEKESL